MAFAKYWTALAPSAQNFVYRSVERALRDLFSDYPTRG
jgi:hypothetical protein